MELIGYIIFLILGYLLAIFNPYRYVETFKDGKTPYKAFKEKFKKDKVQIISPSKKQSEDKFYKEV